MEPDRENVSHRYIKCIDKKGVFLIKFTGEKIENLEFRVAFAVHAVLEESGIVSDDANVDGGEVRWHILVESENVVVISLGVFL